MKIRIELTLPMDSNEYCLGVLESLEPDNYTTPQGITIEMACRDSTLVVNILSENASILTVRNTVDDIIVHVNLVMRSISLFSKELGKEGF